MNMFAGAGIDPDEILAGDGLFFTTGSAAAVQPTDAFPGFDADKLPPLRGELADEGAATSDVLASGWDGSRRDADRTAVSGDGMKLNWPEAVCLCAKSEAKPIPDATRSTAAAGTMSLLKISFRSSAAANSSSSIDSSPSIGPSATAAS
jgi:hypothetical protein